MTISDHRPLLHRYLRCQMKASMTAASTSEDYSTCPTVPCAHRSRHQPQPPRQAPPRQCHCLLMTAAQSSPQHLAAPGLKVAPTAPNPADGCLLSSNRTNLDEVTAHAKHMRRQYGVLWHATVDAENRLLAQILREENIADDGYCAAACLVLFGKSMVTARVVTSAQEPKREMICFCMPRSLGVLRGNSPGEALTAACRCRHLCLLVPATRSCQAGRRDSRNLDEHGDNSEAACAGCEAAEMDAAAEHLDCRVNRLCDMTSTTPGR